MSEKNFKKGSQLFALARKQADLLGVPYEKNGKMADLIRRIQASEDNPPCFQQQDVCSQNSCCWQASCTAVMDND